jgi:hypothetical protein
MDEIEQPATPASPSASFSRRLFVGAGGALLAAGELVPGGQANAQSRDPGISSETFAERESLKTAKLAVQDIKKTILTISREVWNKPAVGLLEQEAMEVHIRELEAAGFAIVSRDRGGTPQLSSPSGALDVVDQKSDSCPSTTHCPDWGMLANRN